MSGGHVGWRGGRRPPVSPNRARRAKAGAGRRAGRWSASPSRAANSALRTGSGATALIGPRAASFRRTSRTAPTASSIAIQLIHWRPLAERAADAEAKGGQHAAQRAALTGEDDPEPQVDHPDSGIGGGLRGGLPLLPDPRQEIGPERARLVERMHRHDRRRCPTAEALTSTRGGRPQARQRFGEEPGAEDRGCRGCGAWPRRSSGRPRRSRRPGESPRAPPPAPRGRACRRWDPTGLRPEPAARRTSARGVHPAARKAGSRAEPSRPDAPVTATIPAEPGVTSLMHSRHREGHRHAVQHMRLAVGGIGDEADEAVRARREVGGEVLRRRRGRCR